MKFKKVVALVMAVSVGAAMLSSCGEKQAAGTVDVPSHMAEEEVPERFRVIRRELRNGYAALSAVFKITTLYALSEPAVERRISCAVGFQVAKIRQSAVMPDHTGCGAGVSALRAGHCSGGCMIDDRTAL